MRYEAHDKRFEIFDADPDCSSKVKNKQLPQWIHSEPGTSKTMDFDLPSFCNNTYKPEIEAISRKLDIGSKYHAISIHTVGMLRDRLQHFMWS